MNATVAFIIGVVVGWLAKWIYDSFIANKGDAKEEALRAELSAADKRNQDLQVQLAAARSKSAETSAAPQIIAKDRLQDIKGIGTVFARRFNEAGVYSFADLAALSPERAREIINPEVWQAIDPESWVAEAEALAQK